MQFFNYVMRKGRSIIKQFSVEVIVISWKLRTVGRHWTIELILISLFFSCEIFMASLTRHFVSANRLFGDL